jgi:hypothetical protein
LRILREPTVDTNHHNVCSRASCNRPDAQQFTAVR